jgi:predicted MPP superfamily phosphohydrolase
MSFNSSGNRPPNLDAPPVSSPGFMTRRNFLRGASACGVGLAAYAGTFGRHHLEITHRTITIVNLPDAFLGFRLVQISDIHLEEFTEAWFLEHVVAQVNALKPELVLITGDFVSRGPLARPVAWRAAGLAAEILSGIKAPQRFAVLGNHDAAVGPQHVIPVLEAHGTPFLVDSYFALERGYDRLWLCGTDDATNNPTLSGTLPSDLSDHRAPIILMCHEPDYADTLALDPRFQQVDLMLSGHSHGGQVRLPFAGPLILPPLGKKYVQGLFHIGRTQLYVNRGIGTVGMPFRLDCPAEITEITLVRA